MKTVFLQDRPAKYDSFGAHERIARSLATMIKNEKEGKAISLMGTWGSGKSTIINLLETEFATDDKTAIFTYDAWEHKKDPIRRSYIEEFHDFLLKELKIINKKQFEYDLNRLSCNVEDKETTSEPKVTTLGKWALFFLYLVPLGLILLKVGLENSQQILVFPDIEKVFLSWSTTSLNVGIFLLFWPFIFAGICRLFKRDIFNVFTKQTTTIDKTNTIKTNDPTALEFKEIYVKLLNEAVHKGVKIIAVIDNLDRMARDEVLDLWSTMQTLLDVGRHHNDISKQFWLIVPFDQSTPKRVWDCEAEAEINGDGNIKCKKPCVGERDQEGIGKRFVNKTFQVAIKVPPIRLTSWKYFFLKKMSEAFPDNTEQEHYDCFSLYELFEVKRKPHIYSPTPREIIIFINKIAALHNSWKEEISLPVQALYVLCEEDIHVPEDHITSEYLFKNYESRVLQIIGDVEWHKYFAALYFGIDIDAALAVLMTEKIKKSLEANMPENLSKMSSVPGINDILINAISEVANDTNEFFAISNSINALKNYEFSDVNIESRAWDILSCRYADLIKMEDISIDSIDSLELILEKVDNNIGSNLIHKTGSLVCLIISSDNLTEKLVYDYFIRLVEISRKCKLEESLKSSLIFDKASHYMRYLLNTLDVIKNDYQEYILLENADLLDLNKFFYNSIEAGELSQKFNEVCVFLYSKGKVDPDTFYEVAHKEFGVEGLLSKSSESTVLFLELSLELANRRGCSAAVEYLDKIVNEGGLFHFFTNDHFDKGVFHLALLITTLYLTKIPGRYGVVESDSGLNVFKSMLNDPNYDLIDKEVLHNLVFHYDLVEDLTRRVDDSAFKPFVQQIVADLISIHDEDIFTPDQFVRLHNQIFNIVENYNVFVSGYISRNNIREAIAINDIHGACRLYNLVISKISDSQECIEKIISYLNLLNEETWKIQIIDKGLCYLLANKVKKFRSNGFLLPKSLIWLKSHIKELALDSSIKTNTSVNTFINYLTPEAYDDIVDYIAQRFNANAYNEKLLKLLTPTLESDLFLSRYVDRYALDILSPLLHCESYYGIKFVLKRATKDFAKTLSVVTKKRFYDNVFEAYIKQSGPSKAGIYKLGKKLGITRIIQAKKRKKILGIL